MPALNYNKIKISGSWASIANQYVKVNGSWVAATTIYTKVNGAWKTSFPFPFGANVEVSAITVNGTAVTNGSTVDVAGGASSVTLAVTTVNPASTISGAVTGTGSATGSVTVAYSTDPNATSFTVTSQDGLHTATYTIYINVASSLVVYWAYCSGYNPPVSGSTAMTGYSTVTDACNALKLQKGSPSNWTCGASAPSLNCGTAPPPPPACVESCGGCVTTSTYAPCKSYTTCYYNCAGTVCYGPHYDGPFC